MTETELVRAAQGGDESAFEELVRTYEKRIYRLSLRMCGNQEDALEIAQEAFLGAWRGLRFFRGDSSFSTWLYRLASNAAVDFLRREGRHSALAGLSLDDEALGLDPPDAPAASPHAQLERKELRAALEEGLMALSAEHRQILLLRELEGLSYEEIAAALDLDLGTVKSRIARARSSLRKYLVQTGNFSPASPSK